MVKHGWSRWGWHVLLALLMLLLQQASLRHSLGHALADDEGTPTHVACLECLALHAGADTLTPAVPTLALLAHAHVQVAATAHAGREPRTERPYQSRAPPRTSA